jgi:hypothetical protein
LSLCLGRIDLRFQRRTRLAMRAGVRPQGSKRKRNVCGTVLEDLRAEQHSSLAYPFSYFRVRPHNHRIASSPGQRTMGFRKTPFKRYCKHVTATCGCLRWMGWCASMGSVSGFSTGKRRPPSPPTASNSLPCSKTGKAASPPPRPFAGFAVE